MPVSISEIEDLLWFPAMWVAKILDAHIECLSELRWGGRSMSEMRDHIRKNSDELLLYFGDNVISLPLTRALAG